MEISRNNAQQGWPGWTDLTACSEQERQEWAEVGVWSEAERPEPRPAPPMAWIDAVRISANPQESWHFEAEFCFRVIAGACATTEPRFRSGRSASVIADRQLTMSQA